MMLWIGSHPLGHFYLVLPAVDPARPQLLGGLMLRSPPFPTHYRRKGAQFPLPVPPQLLGELMLREFEQAPVFQMGLPVTRLLGEQTLGL